MLLIGLIVNNQLIDKSSLRIFLLGKIYNTDPTPTKGKTPTINWVGCNTGIVISEIGSFAKDLKLRSVASQRGE
jgi:hypothetical protein